MFICSGYSWYNKNQQQQKNQNPPKKTKEKRQDGNYIIWCNLQAETSYFNSSAQIPL